MSIRDWERMAKEPRHKPPVGLAQSRTVRHQASPPRDRKWQVTCRPPRSGQPGAVALHPASVRGEGTPGPSRHSGWDGPAGASGSTVSAPGDELHGMEGCEGHSDHSRALRGVHDGGNRVSRTQSEGRREGGVAVHPSLRGQLDRRGRAVLRRPADGPRFPEYLRVHGHPHPRNASETGLHEDVGHSRSLAHMGTATGRKERLQGAGMAPVA